MCPAVRRQRQNVASIQAREELMDASAADSQEILDRNVDLLRYLAERDSIAIGSCAELVRHEPQDVLDEFERQRQAQVLELERKQQAEEKALVAFAASLPRVISATQFFYFLLRWKQLQLGEAR